MDSKLELDVIPVRDPLDWEHEPDREEDGEVTLVIDNSPSYRFEEWLYRFFGTPREKTMDLDDVGSWVWLEIDGEKTIEEIAVKLDGEFGERVDPPDETLAVFLAELKERGVLRFKRPPEVDTEDEGRDGVEDDLVEGGSVEDQSVENDPVGDESVGDESMGDELVGHEPVEGESVEER
ncbi:MAG: PqqD family protein [Halobacteria archaeon]